jgi:hypothetical protein
MAGPSCAVSDAISRASPSSAVSCSASSSGERPTSTIFVRASAQLTGGDHCSLSNGAFDDVGAGLVEYEGQQRGSVEDAPRAVAHAPRLSFPKTSVPEDWTLPADAARVRPGVDSPLMKFRRPPNRRPSVVGLLDEGVLRCPTYVYG